ncbi:hypothetical protein HK405_002884 [Cladochytrium tenue]|nr:hypothetical protein HK405_002884 [Cladochytrium tenue]
MNTAHLDEVAQCVSPLYQGEGDLNKGESVCLDRCVNKFMLVNTMIAKISNDIGTSLAKDMGLEVPQ